MLTDAPFTYGIPLVGMLLVAELQSKRVVTGRCTHHAHGWVTIRFRNGGNHMVPEKRVMLIIEEDKTQ